MVKERPFLRWAFPVYQTLAEEGFMECVGTSEVCFEVGEKKRLFLLLLLLTLPGTGWAQSDDFDGDGPLVGYTTNNPSSLPDVQRVAGRYRANLTDNTDNVTLHFNQSQGRLDAKLVRFPFVYIARNIGIGTQADSQTAPAPNGNPYIFSGIQVHVTDLGVRNSSHVVVGHRGSTHFTIEGKNTVGGSSSVNDDGFGVLPLGRADIRIEGTAERTLIVSWQSPNLTQDPGDDSFQLYRGTGTLPGQAPVYGEAVYIGLITYAFELGGVPFVGTCDGVEFFAEEEVDPAGGPRFSVRRQGASGLGSFSAGPLVAGKTYELQSTQNLVDWSAVESHTPALSIDEYAFDYSVTELTGRVFYRVREIDEGS